MFEVHCEFPDSDKFHAKYQRNNKRTGLKNLRCYPFCGPEDTHHESSFCGEAVRCSVSFSGETGIYSLQHTQVWGEFVSKTEDNARFPVGCLFKKSHLEVILRIDKDHVNPLYEPCSSVLSGNMKHFSFESQKKGWKYPWKGNKYAGEKPHAFAVYVAVATSEALDTFQCVGVFHSPEFTMFCRRRHKTVSEAEKKEKAAPVPKGELVKCHVLDSSGRIPEFGEAMLSMVDKGMDEVKLEKVGDLKVSGQKRTDSAASAAQNTPTPEGRKKMREQRDPTDAKIVRILAAISNIENLRRRMNQDIEGLSSSVEKKSSPPPDCLEPLEDLDLGWLDSLGVSIQDIFPSDELDLFKENVDTIFDLDLKGGSLVDSTRSKALDVVEALARYLIEEESFTAAILKVAADSTYSDFIQTIHLHVTDFLKEQFDGMTIEDLDSALRGDVSALVPERREMKSAFDTLVNAAVLRDNKSVEVIHGKHSLTSSSQSNEPSTVGVPMAPKSTSEFQVQFPPGITMNHLLLKPRPWDPNTNEPPMVAGKWIRPDVATEEMERMRGDIEWVSRAMLRNMEKKFELHQPQPELVIAELSPKLLSSGVVQYHLDGVVRTFEFTSPLGQTTLAKHKVAWAIGPCCCIMHIYSDTKRLLRANWRVGENELHGLHIYQTTSEDGWNRDGARPGHSQELLTEDGWKVVHVMAQICKRDVQSAEVDVQSVGVDVQSVGVDVSEGSPVNTS